MDNQDKLYGLFKLIKMYLMDNNLIEKDDIINDIKNQHNDNNLLIVYIQSISGIRNSIYSQRIYNVNRHKLYSYERNIKIDTILKTHEL